MPPAACPNNCPRIWPAVARQHGLAPLVRRHVADISHRDRNHPARAAPVASRASASPGSVETVPQIITSTAAIARHCRHRAILPETVADRPDDELNRAVGERIGGDHDGGGTHGGVEVGRDLRQ